MPVELHVHTAGPLDYGIFANSVVEGGNDESGAIGAGSTHCEIHVRHQVADALGAEWKWHRRGITEH